MRSCVEVVSVLHFDDGRGDFFLTGAWQAYGYIGNQRAARAKNFCPSAFTVWQREGGKLRQIKDTEWDTNKKINLIRGNLFFLLPA